ncbi:TetR/AcrR family transcriptional regulator [Streptomyces heilongjiangensis]|uniref:TetR/AcrR family transcriptional regulator n=1 Tax=Streptomyces heilongjiangensis TaxID=945052 RepID=A0ABW1BIY2_9ACTN|nr:TetR/AcrR family transcriptional regulator [Streptomyces heilongjiangensis]MDC2951968.1 TetR/AcrR family transcriptional regulator [Streptomyces heilongjiangensis]
MVRSDGIDQARKGPAPPRILMGMLSAAEPPAREEPHPTAKPRRSRRRTGTYAAADERRRSILEAAIAHFAHKGYHNASMQKIAADVGISHTGLLHHFGSKRELLRAVLEAREGQAVEQFYQRLDPDAPDPVQLFRLIAEQTRFNVTQPGLMQMYSLLAAEAGSEDHPAHAYFRDRYDRVLDVIAKAVRHGVEAGTVRPGTDGHAVARQVLAVADGFQIQWALSDGTFDILAAHLDYLDDLCRRLTTDHRGLDAA